MVGTNGVKITDNLAALLKHEGVRGLSLSLDALDEERHDAFRRVTRRLAEHRRGREDPRSRRAAVHRADDGRPRTTSTSSPRSPTSPTHELGATRLEPLLPGADRTRRARLRPRRRSVRPRARRASRPPPPLRRQDARQRQVCSALRPSSCKASEPTRRLLQDLRGRRRRLPRGNALHGHPPER